ncbi:TPA: S9 family peptidase, partial [Neisseria gonorrhoeae]
HALKFYAKLRETSPQSWLYSPDGGGHTGNGTQRESADKLACVLLFLKEFLG